MITVITLNVYFTIKIENDITEDPSLLVNYRVHLFLVRSDSQQDLTLSLTNKHANVLLLA